MTLQRERESILNQIKFANERIAELNKRLVAIDKAIAAINRAQPKSVPEPPEDWLDYMDAGLDAWEVGTHAPDGRGA